MELAWASEFFRHSNTVLFFYSNCGNVKTYCESKKPRAVHTLSKTILWVNIFFIVAFGNWYEAIG